MSFLERFNFMIINKSKASNLVVDALNRRTTILVTTNNKVIGFESLKELHETNDDFKITSEERDMKQHQV